MRSIARLRAVVISQAPRVVGDAVARPALGGDRERLLRGFLGEVEVAEEADQGGEDAAPLLAEDLLERRYHSTDRTDLDRAAHAGRGDARGHLDRRVEVVGLEDEAAAEGLLDLDERAVGGQRLAVLDPHGGRVLGQAHRHAGGDAGRLVDRLVVGVDLLLLLLGQARPRLGRSGAGSCPDRSASCTSSLPPVSDGRA